MKTLLFALFFLSTFTSNLPSLATAELVLDSRGRPLRNGGLYYIMPYIFSLGGGLELAKTGNETCPLTVARNPFEVNPGKPLRISSRLKFPFIRTVDDLEIAFNDVPECAPTPSKWTVVEGLPKGGWQVKITGYDKLVLGSFRIEKYGSAQLPHYRLMFYPQDGIAGGDLFIYQDDNGIERVFVNNIVPLVATDINPLIVVFYKVESGSLSVA